VAARCCPFRQVEILEGSYNRIVYGKPDTSRKTDQDADAMVMKSTPPERQGRAYALLPFRCEGGVLSGIRRLMLPLPS